MIDIRPVGHILGWLVLVLGFLMVPCILIDIYDGNPNAREFALTAVITIVTGAGIAVACAGAGPPDLDLRQGFLLTSGAWAIFPAVAGLPLMLGDPHLSFTDAYFELTSAMTTTGGTVIVGLDHLARGALLWRGLVNWIGGMGVILLALILLPVLNVGGMQLLRNADFATLDKVMPRAKSIALSIGAVYLALTLACAGAYVWAGMSGFDGAVHAMSTLATGGMANYDSSFASFGPAVLWVGTVFMLIGSLSFIRYVQLARGDPGALWRDSQIRTFLAIYLAFTLGLLVARALHGDVVGADRGARGRLQHGLDHLDDRLHLDRLRPLGPARRDAVLLRDDGLRLLGLDRRRPQGVPLPAALSGDHRRGPPAAPPERGVRAALPGRAGHRRGARTRSSPSSCCSS